MIPNLDIKKYSGVVGYAATLVSALFIAYGFFYNTKSSLEDHSAAIKKVEVDVLEIKAKINKADVFQGVSTAEYNALKDKVAGIERTVDKIDEKIDKVIIQTK